MVNPQILNPDDPELEQHLQEIQVRHDSWHCSDETPPAEVQLRDDVNYLLILVDKLRSQLSPPVEPQPLMPTIPYQTGSDRT